MKLFFTSSLAFFILFASACKKEKGAAKLNKIAGEYTIYEVVQQDPYLVEPWPNTFGTYGKFEIKSQNDSSATLTVLMYDKNNKEVRNDPWTCKVTQNPDGDIMLVEDGYLAAFIRSDYRLNFVGYDNARINARKK